MAGYDFTDFMRRDRTNPTPLPDLLPILEELSFVINSLATEFHGGRVDRASDKMSNAWKDLYDVREAIEKEVR